MVDCGGAAADCDSRGCAAVHGEGEASAALDAGAGERNGCWGGWVGAGYGESARARAEGKWSKRDLCGAGSTDGEGALRAGSGDGVVAGGGEDETRDSGGAVVLEAER